MLSNLIRSYSLDAIPRPSSGGTSSRKSLYFVFAGTAVMGLLIMTCPQMMRERGLSAHYSTLFRWVPRYAPEINKRMRPHLKIGGTSYRIET